MNTAPKPDNAVAPATAHIAGLDGLRALAVLAVIGYHFIPGAFRGGYVGVDVFFVISGFLITGLLVRERAQTGAILLGSFWVRRARRLLPALVLVVLGCSAAAFLVGGDVLVGLGTQLLGAATFSSNWLSIARGSSYFGTTSPELFRNLWSLAVEEQFYLLWPLALLLVRLLRRRWMRVALAAAVATASAVSMALLAGSDPTRVYYGTDTHSFGLALGAALAFLLEGAFLGRAPGGGFARRVLPIVGALGAGGIIAFALLMPDDGSFVTHGGLAIVAGLTALVIAGVATGGSWLGRALDVAALRWIGQRSYGLYLWHWPVLVLFAAALPLSTPWWIAPACALVVTVGAAGLSYRFVEVPVRRYGLRGAAASLRPRPLLVRTAAGAGALFLGVALALTGAGVAVAPPKTEAELAIEAGQQAVADAAAHPRPTPTATPEPTAVPTAAATPEPASGDQIYAIGDSVMLAAAPELQAAFPGIAIDAEVSRPLGNAPAIVQSIVDSGALRPILIVGLGTNGPIREGDLFRIVDIVGPETRIVVVNAQAPRDWIPGVNAAIADFATKERNVELADWHDTIAPRIDELNEDQIHPGGPISGGIYVSAIQAALQRLAELPARTDPGQLRHPV